MLFRLWQAGRGPGQYAAGMAFLIVAIAIWVNNVWFFSVEVRDGLVRQRRFFGLGDRSVPTRDITSVTLRIGQNFMGMDVRALKIGWNQQVIQLNSSYYATRDLRALTAQLLQEGVLVFPDVRSWLDLQAR
jgi:hypothetical protein